MKKNYVKPELFYESFVLSQHIAGCVLGFTKLGDEQSCVATGTIDLGAGKPVYSESWFTSTTNDCMPTIESYCYTNGLFQVTSFNS